MSICQFRYSKKQGGFNAGDKCPNIAGHFGFCVKHRRLVTNNNSHKICNRERMRERRQSFEFCDRERELNTLRIRELRQSSEFRAQTYQRHDHGSRPATTTFGEHSRQLVIYSTLMNLHPVQYTYRLVNLLICYIEYNNKFTVTPRVYNRIIPCTYMYIYISIYIDIMALNPLNFARALSLACNNHTVYSSDNSRHHTESRLRSRGRSFGSHLGRPLLVELNRRLVIT